MKRIKPKVGDVWLQMGDRMFTVYFVVEKEGELYFVNMSGNFYKIDEDVEDGSRYSRIFTLIKD